MAESTDLLEILESIIQERDIAEAVGVVQSIEEYSRESNFPQITIMDAGETVETGASEGIEKEKVFIIAYADYIGDGRKGVLEVRNLMSTVREILSESELYYQDGPLKDYSFCRFARGENAQNISKSKKNEEFVVVKIAIFEFWKHVVNL